MAIVHTIYAIYHLARPAGSRAPASSASYALFSCVLDAGLAPFYAFASFAACREFTDGVYNWGSLFENDKITASIVQALFLASAVCGGLHLISLVISIYLAVVFRMIARLPPDMNPLEEDSHLTARPKHRRGKLTKTEIMKEKHLSDSTLASSTRTIPFSHTRQDSSTSLNGSPPASPGRDDTPPSPQIPPRSGSPGERFYKHYNQSKTSLPGGYSYEGEQREQQQQQPAKSPSRSNSVIDQAPVLRPSSGNYAPIRWASNASSSESSANWVAYPSSTGTPANDDDPDDLRKPSSRNSSLLYSGNGDWRTYVSKFGRVNVSRAEEGHSRGEYTALQSEECYGDDDDEKDHGNGVTENKENAEQKKNLGDGMRKLVQNPLTMNPPTPLPKPTEQENITPGRALTPSSSRKASATRPRAALADISVNRGDVNDEQIINSNNNKNNNNTTTTTTQESIKTELTSTKDEPTSSPSKKINTRKIWTLRGGVKQTHYEAIQVHEEEEEDHLSESDSPSSDPDPDPDASDSDNNDNKRTTPPRTLSIIKRGRRTMTPSSSPSSSSHTKEKDRKGRVVSNSGIDLGRGLSGPGSSYNSYISGLGVGRRREVSGKVAEEGRGGLQQEERIKAQPTQPIRAAGWARFAGL